MADSPIFPRFPFLWHFNLSQETNEDGIVHVGHSGENGCFLEGVSLVSHTRPVLNLLSQEIGESDPQWVMTVAPDDLDFTSGFVDLKGLPSPHTPLRSGIRIPPNVSIYLQVNEQTETLALTWEETEGGGNFPLTWEDSESLNWEQTTPDFIFARGSVTGRLC